MQLYRQSTNSLVTLQAASLLGTGGEARIYTVTEHPALAAKLYHRPSETQALKLAAMLANPPQQPVTGHVAIAWPVDLLRSVDGQRIVGFLMPRVVGAYPLITFYNPAARKQNCPLFNASYLYRTARNLAAAMRALHAASCVVGDVNESNILVTSTALVTLVDTDSFQIRDAATGEIHRCRVGKPEFTPPELAGARFADVSRRPEHDLFGFAVLAFQLLMEGTHPFEGVYQGRGEAPPYHERIAAGHFPHSPRARSPYLPKATAPDFATLHPRLRELFIRCFVDGHRDPSARPDTTEWQDALDEAEAALTVCTVNEQHRYGSHLDECPWCQRAQLLGGRDPFPSRQAVQRGQHVDPKPAQQSPKVIPTRIAFTAPAAPLTFAPPLPSPRRWPRYGLSAAIVLVALALFIPMVRSLIAGRNPFTSSHAASMVATLPGHQGWVYSVALSPSADRIATADSAGVVRLWEFASRRRLWSQSDGSEPVHAVAFSLDGGILASAGRGGDVLLRHSQDGRLARRLTGHAGPVKTLAFSPDGRLLASAGVDTTIRLWDVAQGEHVATLSGQGRLIQAVAFSPDGARLASGGWGGEIWLWDVRTRTHVAPFTGHEDAVLSLAWWPDGQQFASSAADGSIRIWDSRSSRFRRLDAGKSDVHAVAVHPDGESLLSAGMDGHLRFWGLDGRLLGLVPAETGGVWSMALSRDGQALVTGGMNSAKLWKLE